MQMEFEGKIMLSMLLKQHYGRFGLMKVRLKKMLSMLLILAMIPIQPLRSMVN
jgi:hypothetical protein